MRYSLDGVEEAEGQDDEYSRANPARPGFTKFDQKDMWRMGKLQELKRNYRPLSALSFAVVLTAVWEFLLIANTQGLVDGGVAGVFWSYIWTFIGFGFVELSLAEMASMAPISGGQYHWVSEFAPPKFQQFLSYMVGWMSTLSWQAGNASGSYLTGTIVQALLVVNYPTYEPQRWQGTLLVFAMVLVLFIVNIWGAQIWPRIQNGLLILHVLAFLAVIITLWVMAPHRSAKSVFTEFTNMGGWSTMGLSLMVGQITAIYSMLGSDATAHMAEEVRDAGRYVPISLFWSYVGNGIMAIIFLITYLFSIDDVEAALDDPTTYPFIYVFKSAVSTAGVNALTIIVLILVIAANISFNASTARQTFAFARDRGLPFSKWIGHVDAGKEIPANAIILTCVFTMLLSLINIGSTTAFNAIISLQVVALMTTYTVSIGCVLYRRITHPDLIPTARWSLGKWGVPVNCLGLAYVSFVFFWSFWPNETPVALDTFNWAVVMYVGVLVLSLLMYIFQGRKVYNGPVTEIRASRLD
ncbi:amino acid transporter [Lindgomyces ingoldianus]|uniref:Amino acid transporter n=1 Tax=Lindgomyces ingoldianus TaxID=673940 RepID=A0ACB6QU22_9PLEO|nr:amino acid transporter [Lindgomyces ingoldianus]KAF2470504.1 amino acid transporter [Lindgomyces ingoldianus]